jgi:hypothetical protein
VGLALDEMAPGGIVDWTYDTFKNDKGTVTGRLVPREQIRRGIIVRVQGDIAEQSVQGVYIKFDRKEKEVYCANTNELVLVYPARTKVAREAWRRVMGGPRDVGHVRVNKSIAKRPVLTDALGVTPMGREHSSPGTVEKALASAGIDDLVNDDGETYTDDEGAETPEEKV